LPISTSADIRSPSFLSPDSPICFLSFTDKTFPPVPPSFSSHFSPRDLASSSIDPSTSEGVVEETPFPPSSSRRSVAPPSFPRLLSSSCLRKRGYRTVPRWISSLHFSSRMTSLPRESFGVIAELDLNLSERPLPSWTFSPPFRSIPPCSHGFELQYLPPFFHF